ncbi:MAG TPA: hypothetical protein VMA13_07620 [Candidatus Saccharimonadales bacterium]|nr:hypothetical protein [Candidatus Saccharimonadales bacterium]
MPRFASQGWMGLILLAVCWPLNWTLPGQRTAYLFFPLWLGYILFVDGLVCWRAGSSLWARSRKGFVQLFVLSVPAWWLFEFINDRTGNWEYLGADSFTSLEYYALCTLSFSTVMPAVFETAEFVRTFRWVNALRPGGRVPDIHRVCLGLLFMGLAMLTLTLLWPKFFYPFVWISLVLIFEPLNRWLGRRHFLEWLRHGDWRPVISLSLGALICGFFWEMWNYWSWPRWIYHTPGANFLHIFEMPLLGYGGYIPFALELFALKNFLWSRGPRLEL